MEHRCDDRLCGTCQFWTGEREIVRGTRPVRVSCESGSHACTIKRFTTLSNSSRARICEYYKKSVDLP